MDGSPHLWRCCHVDLRWRKWLQQPGGKDGAPGADGNIADATEQGVIATWDDTAGQWTPDGAVVVKGSNVGIGTDSPVTPLAVKGAASDQQLEMGNFAGGAYIESYDRVAGQYGDLVLAGETFTFQRSISQPRLTIDSTGDATFSGMVDVKSAAPVLRFTKEGSYAWQWTVDGSNSAVLQNSGGTVNALTVTPATGDATFSGTARFETLNNPLMLRGGEDVYSIGVASKDVEIYPAATACVVYDTWQTHYFERTDPDALQPLIYCDGDATFGGQVNIKGQVHVGDSGEKQLFYKGGDGIASIRTRTDDGATTGYVTFERETSGANATVVRVSSNRMLLGSGSSWATTGMRLDNSGNLVVQGSITKNGSTPLISARDLIETLHTLREATKDETTIKGLRDAIGNAVGGLIEKFEAMQAQTQEISDGERIVDNPANHGWVEENGKWVWEGGAARPH